MSNKKKTTSEDESLKPIQRFHLVIIAMFVLGLVVMGRITYLTYFESAYWEKVSRRFVKENDAIPAQRGNILAADGQVLATSLPQFRIYMDFIVQDRVEAQQLRGQAFRDSIICADTLRVIPGLLNKRREVIPEETQRHHIDSCRRALTEICEGMHKIIPDIDPAEFRKKLIAGRAKGARHMALYNKRITYVQYQAIKKLPLFRCRKEASGFHIEEFHARNHPYGKLAARTVGDLYGGKDSARCGLEQYYDSLLRGKPGSCHKIKVLNEYIKIVDEMPQNGCDVHTTLDIGIQDIVEMELGNQIRAIEADMGTCVVMEVATGDIKAIANIDRINDGSYREISNRAVTLCMEPGSVFKTVSFMVGLDDGAFKMTDAIDTGNGVYEMYRRKMKDSNWRAGGHGYITASEVLQCSSNIGTSRLIDRFYHDHPERYIQGIYRTGIHDDLQIPLKGCAKPWIRMPKKDSTGRHWANWSNTALPWMSIGYETNVPPIYTLTFYNGIANGGKMVYPRFVTSITKGEEVVESIPVRVVRQQMCKPSTIKDLQEALRLTVVKGTGKPCGSKHFSVSGKTGTAQIWNKHGNTNKYLISFVGYFPSENPKYSMIVCIKKSSPAYGGQHCGPVFKHVAEAIMARKHVTNYKQATDTLHAHLPQVHPGNAAATSQLLSDLSLDHSRDNTQGQWGRTTLSGSKYYTTTENTNKGTMPNLLGYGLRDAVYRLEHMGLRVTVQGTGRVVRQSVAPGTIVKRGNTVHITLSTDPRSLPKEEPKPEKPDSLPADTSKQTKQA